MKKQLEIQLSKLKTIINKNIKLEQYQTEGKIAADILWAAHNNNDIKDKIVADFGCGNGILGIGALLLGAKKVYFIDKDKESIEITKLNNKFNNAEYYECDILEFNKKIDTVIMNPPFGVQNRKADKKFLEKAFMLSKKIYSLHKIESKVFIEKISQEYNFEIIKIIPFNLRLKKTYKFHKRNIYDVYAGLWILNKK